MPYAFSRERRSFARGRLLSVNPVARTTRRLDSSILNKPEMRATASAALQYHCLLHSLT